MTLLEIVISMTIVCILGCCSIVSFSNIRHLQETASVTQSLQQSLYFAREQAVLRYQSIVIMPKNGLWQNGWDIETGKRKLKSYAFQPMKIIYIPFQTAVHFIKVFPDGTTNGYQGHFEYANTKLIINRGGRSRIE